MAHRKTLIVIDGNAILHRAYHALPPMHTKDGIPTNAVYGFTSLLIKVLNDMKPDALAVAFDMKGPTFRDELYEAYKATREKKPQELYDQLLPIKDILKCMDIPYYEKTGFEADDVIGTIAQNVIDTYPEWKLTIITGDLDELQLVHERVSVCVLKKGISDYQTYTEEVFRERYGFSSSQLIDFKALKGDSSDNIKGVQGIGEKTASSLIVQYGTIAGIYQALDDGTFTGFSSSVQEKLRNGRDSAFLALKLVTIIRDVPIDFGIERAILKGFDEERVRNEFSKLEFMKLLPRLSMASTFEVKQHTQVAYRVIDSDEMWKKYLISLRSATEIALFIDTLNIVGIFDGSLCYVFTLTPNRRRDIAELISRKSIRIVSFDVKSIFHRLELEKPYEVMFDDCMLLEYALHAGRSIKLDEILCTYASVQYEMDGTEMCVASVVRGLMKCRNVMRLQVVEQRQLSITQSIEYPLLPVLYMMERAGIMLNTEQLADVRKHVVDNLSRLQTTMYTEVGQEFNIASPSQLKDILFDVLKLPTTGIKKGKTGFSTAASELGKLHGLHPIIEEISEHRELSKLLSTYIDALPELVAQDLRIHTTFNQAVAATGRLASSNPNVQNIPMRTELGREVRAAFVASPGYVLLSADYSQFELRIVAHLSGDKNLTQIFLDCEDVHTATAAKIHHIPISEVTKDIRRTAKEVNFGVLYGMQAHGLAERTGISRFEAAEFIKKYFSTFSGVKRYIDEVVQDATKNGYAETLFGRRRELPELASHVFQVKSSGERMAINMPVQGTQADIIKKAMIVIDEKIREHNDEIRMLLQVHDELVFEVKKGCEAMWSPIIQKLMENVVKLSVPIVVDVSIGQNWRDMKKM